MHISIGISILTGKGQHFLVSQKAVVFLNESSFPSVKPTLMSSRYSKQ